MRGKRLWLLAGLALLLAACGGGGAPPQDLALAGVSPDSPTVVQGGSLTLTLTFTSQNGFQGQVSLSVTENGQPPSWLSLSPTSKSLNVPKGGQVQESLQVQVAGDAPTGPHALKLRTTYGDKAAERDLTLTVTAPLPPPDFALSLSPASLTVEQGSSGTTALTVTPQNGFTGTVSLSLAAGQDPVPQGLNLSPQSVQVSGANPVNQPLTLSVSSSTPTGTYRLKVRGTAQNLTKEADLTLTVTAPSPSLVMVLSHDLYRCDPTVTFTGTLEGTPTAPLRLQYALKPKGAQDYGPWQDAGEMQVSGNQATLVLPQPPYPVGMENAPWGIRFRVLMGDQPVGLRSAPNNPVVPFFQITSGCFRPIWLQRGFSSWPAAVVEMAYGAGSLCFYTGEEVLRCLDAATGEERWRFSRPNFRMWAVFVTEDGRVLVAGRDYSTTPSRALVLVLGDGGSLQATYDLSAQLGLITAILLDGNILYVGGVRWVDGGGGSRCSGGESGIYRLLVAKYVLTGSGASLGALYDPTPAEIGELPPDQDGSVPCEDNYSSVAALRLEAGKLYVAFSVGGKADQTGLLVGLPGLLRLDAQGFSRDWVYTPWRPGDRRSPAWGGQGYYRHFGFPPYGYAGAIQYTAFNFSLGNRYLYFHSMAGCPHGFCFSERGPVLVEKETGVLANTDNALLPESFNGRRIHFLPGGQVVGVHEVGWDVIYGPEGGPYSSLRPVLPRPQGSGGVQVMVGNQSLEDPQGGLYVYGQLSDEEFFLARYR